MADILVDLVLIQLDASAVQQYVLIAPLTGAADLMQGCDNDMLYLS